MGAIVLQLESDTLAIPGEESKQSIQILNSGTVVDRFELDVLGEAREWIRIEPAEVNVYPDQTAEVELVFRPPRSAELPAGPVTFGLRVMSHEDIEGSVVEEVTVTVGPFTEFGVRLVPTTKRSRTAGRFSAVVDNRGNAPLLAHLYASDPDAKVGFVFKHEEVEVAHGKGVLVPLKVKPKTRLWRGADLSLPFQVLVVDEDDEEEQTADGALVQAAVVSDGLAKFALAVVAAVVALLALWFLVLQPSVESEAKRQVAVATGQDPNALGASAAGGGAGGKGDAAAGGGGAAAGGAAGDASGTNTGGTDGSRYPALGDSSGGSAGKGGADGGSSPQLNAVDFRIQANVKASDKFVVTRYKVPKDSTYYISDILFENAAGDTGIVRLQRGDSVLMQISLDTYRDRDDHFVEPVEFGPGEDVILSVRCQAPGGQTTTTSTSCTPGAFFSGRAVTSAG
ncbi:COG1470 family protein [Streptomyces cinereoruber]|uniref:COG1470 family protein n=1 Tax=Streptomyces cinereoruber TaxID=67260 RepID=UPI003654C825